MTRRQEAPAHHAELPGAEPQRRGQSPGPKLGWGPAQLGMARCPWVPCGLAAETPARAPAGVPAGGRAPRKAPEPLISGTQTGRSGPAWGQGRFLWTRDLGGQARAVWVRGTDAVHGSPAPGLPWTTVPALPRTPAPRPRAREGGALAGGAPRPFCLAAHLPSLTRGQCGGCAFSTA